MMAEQDLNINHSTLNQCLLVQALTYYQPEEAQPVGEVDS
jgi:hypothetical protein